MTLSSSHSGRIRILIIMSVASGLLFSGLICPAISYAQTGSYNGLVLQAQNEEAFTVPAGRTFTDVNQVDPRQIPADGLSNYTVVYHEMVYASAGASATNVVVGITPGPTGGKTSYSPPVTVPAYATVSVPFEITAPAHAGDLIQASGSMGAGKQGPVTIEFFSCFTVIAYPIP